MKIKEETPFSKYTYEIYLISEKFNAFLVITKL